MASPIDDLTDDELSQLMALPEAERNAVINQLASAPPPDIVMGAPDPAAPVRSEADYYREVMSPEFQAAREAGMQAGAAQAAPQIAKDLGTAALVGAGLGAAGWAGRGALKVGGAALQAARPYATKAAAPLARGAVQTATDVVERGLPISTAVVRGAVAAIKPEAKKMLGSAVEHALKRAAKEAGKPAAEAVKKELRDEIPEKVVEWATTMKKTPKEIVDMLKIKYGQGTFSEVSAKNLVDMILKQAKITPHNTPGAAARAAGQTMNQQIRAARAAQAAKGS